MFEFSIALSEQKADSAKKLYKEIKSTASSFGAVVTSYSENGKIFIVVACDDIEKPRISFFICDAIADIITTDFKLDYINKNLHLPIHNQLNLDALKKALVVFDRETDRYIVTHNLKLNEKFFIESFYDFRLRQLRSKWQELIKLANENANYLLCNDTFIDLLKFLIENIEISTGCINVVKENDSYKICDENFNEIEQEQGKENNEAFLITSIINLSPKRINIYCDDTENSSALTLLSQIFVNRVFILPKCNLCL
ncbi:MAG: putative sporulation protein YtxC [Firmicutes bacterium]|nr:putative sporulation protein YtxC [Bacillota bacterium]